MSVINTNITSMIGQANLNKSQSALQTSMERLSSGLRINSAKDDAAGQAIANRMSAQITGLSQSQRNANDGISVAQTAEGALNQVNDNLQRIRELSVQSQNGTNSANDLQSIQDEIGQRLSEINRISEETSFNGVRVLAEENALQIQVGANDGETITVGLQEINAATLNLDTFSVAGAKAATEADLQSIDGLKEIETVDGVTQYSKTVNELATASDVINDTVLTSGAGEANVVVEGETYNYTAADTFTRAQADYGSGTTASELTPATGYNEVTVNFAGSGQNIDVRIDSEGKLTNAAGEALKLTGTDTNSQLEIAGEGDTQATIEDVANEIAATNGTAGDTITDGNEVYAGLAASSQIDKTTTLDTEEMISYIDGKEAVVEDDTIPTNTYTISAEGSVSQGGNPIYVDADTDALTTDDGGYSESYYVQEDSTVNTQQNGEGDTVYFESEVLTTDPETKATANPLEALDSALNQVDSLRSELGAIQNRFESAITNLQTNETNLSAARSRIEDADYAVEVANMTRSQILQQAGTSVLAQANQIPQNVLSLLG